MRTLVALALLVFGEALPTGPRWVSVRKTPVHASAAAGSPIIGFLEQGDEVQQTGCAPSCSAKEAWALLAPRGAVRLASLAPALPEEAVPWTAGFVYGHAADGAPVYAAPDPEARVLRHERRAERKLAFVDDPALQQQGWLHEALGGYMRVGQVHLSGPPSELEGAYAPDGPVAFFVRRTPVPRRDGPPFLIERQAALPFLGLDAHGRVRVPGATVSRSAVRLALPRRRPEGVPAGARWVHVDLSEQVLTAYEGDRLVFATLVSTGKHGFETHPGLFRVWLKARYTTMDGRQEPYHVEEVPNVMYFHGPDALHGAFWHDAFGSTISHGCVNLSPRDAAWLFRWAPPSLPEGWHALRPLPDDGPLWVVVERSR